MVDSYTLVEIYIVPVLSVLDRVSLVLKLVGNEFKCQNDTYRDKGLEFCLCVCLTDDMQVWVEVRRT